MMLSSIVDLRLEELLPLKHAAFRPLVRDALIFFGQRLPPIRMAEIAAEQARLPANASAALRLVNLFKLCPTLHKLGQVLARDKHLTPELRARLGDLDSFAPTVNVSELRPAIDRAVGGTSGITVAEHALAEASVAIVVPFAWQKNARREPHQGVMKVLKPGIRERLDQDLAAWSELGAHIEERSRIYGLPELDYCNIIDGVSSRLRHEVTLEREQLHIGEARQLYQGVPGILVPRLFPFCTNDVTAMTRIDGKKLTGAPSRQRERAARLATDALIARPLLRGNGRTPFHADPHPGNLLLTDGGDLAILDWSLVARLRGHERRGLIGILLGALGFDAAGICRGLEKISDGRPSKAELRQVVDTAVRHLRWGARPGLQWMTDLLDRAITDARLTVSEDLVLFRKGLHTLTGVVGELSTADSMDATLFASALRQHLGDCAGAMVNPVNAGSASAAAGNAALFRLWCEAPAAASRFWLGAWRDLLAPGRA